MKWSEELATGIDRIDDQHKMLFKMVEDFSEALDEGGGERAYGSLLEALHLYTRSHFALEERCMEEYKCPVAEKNHEAHVRFAEVLAGFRQRYAETGFDRAEARNLVDTLEGWLGNHICGVDVHLKRCVESA